MPIAEVLEVEAGGIVAAACFTAGDLRGEHVRHHGAERNPRIDRRVDRREPATRLAGNTCDLGHAATLRLRDVPRELELLGRVGLRDIVDVLGLGRDGLALLIAGCR